MTGGGRAGHGDGPEGLDRGHSEGRGADGMLAVSRYPSHRFLLK